MKKATMKGCNHGRVYTNEDDHVVVEMTPEDILYRSVPDGNGGMLSMRTMIKDLAWFILNTHPTGKKMVEKRLITAAMTEVVDGKFVVEFLPGAPVVPEAPAERNCKNDLELEIA